MKRTQHGVTLMELMVVVLIIGIIVAVAVPGYRQYALRTNRTDAKVALASWAAGLERCFTRYRAYNSASCASFTSLPQNVPSGTYRILMIGTPTATTYALQAVPLGGQAQDTQCGTFTITQANVRGLMGGTHTDTAARCWNR